MIQMENHAKPKIVISSIGRYKICSCLFVDDRLGNNMNASL